MKVFHIMSCHYRCLLLIIAIPLIYANTIVVAQRQVQVPSNDIRVRVIPLPSHIDLLKGYFTITSHTTIVYNQANKEMHFTIDCLANNLRRATGYKIEVHDSSMVHMKDAISFNYVCDTALGKEGYMLDVGRKNISINANTDAGCFYAVQTLLQLLPPEIFSRMARKGIRWEIPCVVITDTPRYRWRGMHLDVCRHFFPKEFVKKYIDEIAMYKMNTFHWHLTEDQGWRIEIKKYPKLTEVGAWRSGSMVGRYNDQKFDSIRYGGYYTQDDIREIVAYAAQRHVTIIPEIEMPGHSLAALASYPELSCTGGPFDVAKGWGVFDDVYCPKETTFTFLENVLAEVCELFPGTYIHIGGDEVPKTRWKNCSHCQELMKREGLKDESELQSYFIKRIEKFLNAKGKQIIGWDEILEGGLALNAAVMSWRGTDGGIAAAKQKNNVVMCPGSHCYFDYYQGNPVTEPLAIGGYTTVEKVYSYEPTPTELSHDEQQYILGAQGNVWTEYIQTPEHVEYMALPRMAALAEVLWTPKERRAYPNFQQRLIRNFQYLDVMGIHYSKAVCELKAEVCESPSRNGVKLKLTSLFGVKGIHYTLDGTEPTRFSQVYRSPLNISKTVTVKAAYFEGSQRKGPIVEQRFSVSKSTGKNVSLKNPPNEQYPGNGAFTLVDGIRGDLSRYGQQWLGWWGPNMEATIDLGKSKTISKVTMDAFHGEESWIYLPKSVEVSVSYDNILYKQVKKLTADEIRQMGSVIEMNLGEQHARYVKVISESAGKIPIGKPGAGHDAWLFVDEIGIY